ncbi:MAG: hypothetical protein ACFFCW_33125 [Candidatus Hodarchaeota archaeon]
MAWFEVSKPENIWQDKYTFILESSGGFGHGPFGHFVFGGRGAWIQKESYSEPEESSWDEKT